MKEENYFDMFISFLNIQNPDKDFFLSKLNGGDYFNDLEEFLEILLNDEARKRNMEFTYINVHLGKRTDSTVFYDAFASCLSPIFDGDIYLGFIMLVPHFITENVFNKEVSDFIESCMKKCQEIQIFFNIDKLLVELLTYYGILNEDIKEKCLELADLIKAKRLSKLGRKEQ
jgi:hypothetical protein